MISKLGQDEFNQVVSLLNLRGGGNGLTVNDEVKKRIVRLLQKQAARILYLEEQLFEKEFVNEKTSDSDRSGVANIR